MICKKRGNIVNENLHEFAEVKVYLDEDLTVEYNSNSDVFVEDYYGSEIYIKVTPQAQFTLAIAKYIYKNETENSEIEVYKKLEIYLRNNLRELEFTADDPMNPGETLEYNHKIIINGEVVTLVSFYINEPTYSFEFYYIVD